MARRAGERTNAMKVTPLPIAGALAIVPSVFSDDRGFFKETFSRSRYAELGIAEAFVQDNISVSHRGVLRGLHASAEMAKLVHVVSGGAFDVMVDLRRDSPTYLHWHGVTLRADEHTQVYIPAGCLHGFLSLQDGTVLSYKQSREYEPASEFGVAWDDPELAIAWPLDGSRPVLSGKDASNKTLRELGYL
jgi:dTDP-4-dehydrorhamnose 3,5-epimerase